MDIYKCAFIYDLRGEYFLYIYPVWILCFNAISTFLGYFMPKVSQYKADEGRDERVNTFFKEKKARMNVIVWIYFRFAYDNITDRTRI